MKNMRKIITLSMAVLLLAAIGTNISFAGKPGGGGGGKIKVTGVSPGEAPQGKSLTVKIAGENFVDVSSVTFLVGGTKDADQILVGEIRVTSLTELEAEIVVGSAALTVDYDIEVKATSGRKGKGTTLFRVKQVETTCTGFEPKEPEIAFLTALDLSGDIYTQDLYLSSGSGCDQYLLLEDAVQKLPNDSSSQTVGEYLVDITGLRLDIEGGVGVVAWRDRSIDPIPNFVLRFAIDEFNNITPDPVGLQMVRAPTSGFHAYGTDIRINDLGEVELVMVERAPDNSEWWLTHLNIDTNAYTVLTTDHCPMQDKGDKCFYPSYAYIWWNEDGSAIYFNPNSWPDAGRVAIARIQRDNEQWQSGEILMTHNAQMNVIGVPSGGLLVYERMEFKINRKGNATFIGGVVSSINPDLCSAAECLPSDGTELAADFDKFPRGWTRNGGLLFIETGPGNQKNIREYSNPLTGEVGTLNLRDVDRDQRDTTF